MSDEDRTETYGLFPVGSEVKIFPLVLYKNNFSVLIGEQRQSIYFNNSFASIGNTIAFQI